MKEVYSVPDVEIITFDAEKDLRTAGEPGAEASVEDRP